MVCDFFFPQAGGVEFHIYHLSQKLIELGHSVVVITHAYGSRTGVRYLTNGLKVYYVPYLVLYRETTFPTVFTGLPVLRNILIREEIELVHGHGSVSNLGHECILHATTMGIKTVFTDHSLYGFASTGAILVNKILKMSLSNIDRVICVSNTCKENVVLRAQIDPLMVSVIPNAVLSEDFAPRETVKEDSIIRIVVISRLFPNKGVDLLTQMIPRICAANDNVQFIVAGDGPKFIDFQQMIEHNRLQERVELIGGVNHELVRDVMVRGDIYLHASLTEAFGTVLVEAASCGLLIVTTSVGGIPEVLPSHMTVFAKPEVKSLVEATTKAIGLMENGFDTSSFHDEIASMYDWSDVALRTENVYKSIPDQRLSVLDRLKKFYGCGLWAGKLFVLVAIVDIIYLYIMEWWSPRETIDRATKWPKRRRDM